MPGTKPKPKLQYAKPTPKRVVSLEGTLVLEEMRRKAGTSEFNIEKSPPPVDNISENLCKVKLEKTEQKFKSAYEEENLVLGRNNQFTIWLNWVGRKRGIRAESLEDELIYKVIILEQVGDLALILAINEVEHMAQPVRRMKIAIKKITTTPTGQPNFTPVAEWKDETIYRRLELLENPDTAVKFLFARFARGQ